MADWSEWAVGCSGVSLSIRPLCPTLIPHFAPHWCSCGDFWGGTAVALREKLEKNAGYRGVGAKLGRWEVGA